jgi:hypothetical protein
MTFVQSGTTANANSGNFEFRKMKESSRQTKLDFGPIGQVSRFG